jgi:hypothetical protein
VLYETGTNGEYNQCLEKYGTIFVECTFIGDTEKDKRQAKKTKHMHWSNLQPYIESHPSIDFVLYHFSLRHKPREILDFFASTGIPNIIPLVHDFDEIHMNTVLENVKSGKMSVKTLLDRLTQLFPDQVREFMVGSTAEVEHKCPDQSAVTDPTDPVDPDDFADMGGCCCHDFGEVSDSEISEDDDT